jgi:hypothetical protein
MASKSGSIRAGAAYVEIFADKSPLMRGLKLAEADIRRWGNSISSFGRKMMGIGTAIVAPLVAAAKHVAAYAHEIEMMSQITGVGVEALQGLSYAADQNGVSMQGLGKAMIFMHKNIAAFNKGTKAQVEAFGKLGLAATDLIGKSPDELFMLLADRIASVENPTERISIALKIFGKAGASIIPLLNKGAGAIQAYKAELERLGAVMSANDIQAAAEFHAELKKLWYIIKNGLINSIGSALVPLLKDWTGKMTELIGAATRWIKENRGVVSMVFWLGSAFIAGGIGLLAFGKAMIFCSKIFGIIRGGIIAVRTVLAFLISPIGAIIVAITATVGAFLYFTGYGGKMLNWLGSRFNTLKQDATDAIGGIAAAFAKGDIGLAARIAWLFVKMEWLRAKEWMIGIWYSIKLAIMEIWYAAVYSIAVGWDAAVYGIQVAWIETVAFIKKAWVKSGSFLEGAWITTVEVFKKAWAGFKQFWGSTIDWIAKKLMNVWIWWKKLTDPNFDEGSARKQLDSMLADDKQERDDTANAAKEKAEKDAAAKRLQLEKDTQSEIDGIEKSRGQKREQAKKEFDAGLAGANQYVEEGLKNTIDGINAGKKGVADELAKTKEEFNAAVAKAKEPAKSKNAKTPAPKKDWEANTGLTKASTAGTFSAFGLGQMGAGGVMQKIADSSARTAEATEEIADKMDDSDVEFGD